MKPLQLWLSWMGCLMIFGGVSARGAERWLHGSSPNFEMLSLASEKESRRMLIELERFRENVLAFFPAREGREPRVTVYLFPSDRAFKPYRPLYRGKPKEVSGYFINAPDEVVIAMSLENDPDAIEDPTEIIFHEYLHLLVHTRGLRLPVWLDEGMADLFSTFRIEGKFVEYGRTKELYLALLQMSALMPLGKLLSVTHESPAYNEEMRATMFYAQSWALTHYLMCGTDRGNREKFARYLQALDRPDVVADAAFAEIFGTDYSTLEQKLRSYLSDGQYYQRRVELRPIDEKKIVLRPATEFERELGLVNLGYRVHRSGDSQLRLLRLAQQQPESPRPLEVLALIAAEERETEAAFEYWRRAVALKSTNAFAYVQLARREMLPFRVENFDARLDPERAFELQVWLDRALSLRPGYADAIEVLAQVEARAPALRVVGINKVQNAVRGLRDPNPTLLALAMIRWRANDIATCTQIVDAVTSSSRAAPLIKVAARLLKLRATGTSDAAAASALLRKERTSEFGIKSGGLLETTRNPADDQNGAGVRTFGSDLNTDDQNAPLRLRLQDKDGR